jgi:hypothetical protein
MDINTSVDYSSYPPPIEIKTIVYLIRKLIGILQNLVKQVRSPWNDRRMKMMLFEVVSLFDYQIEQVEGVLCIGGSNLYLFPSAFVISRTVMEINILIEYLLSPQEETERIVRYIQYLESQLCYIDKHKKNVLNSNLHESHKLEIGSNKDNIQDDIADMKSSAIKHGVSSELILNVGKLKSIADMLDDVSPSERQTELRIVYYELSKFSHGMRQSIYRYHDPNFEDDDPLPHWTYPFDICYKSIIYSAAKIIHTFGDITEQFDNDVKPTLEDLQTVISEVFT